MEEKLKHLELRKEQGEKFVNDKDTPVDDELAKAREQKQSEEEEIERLQKSKKVNADEACYVAQEKSVVGNSGSSSSAAASSTREDWENLSYEQFVEKYSGIIDDYLSRKRTLDSAEAFLSDYPMLLSEHALGYMLMQALNHGMREERQKMRRVVANKYHVKSLLDFARETNKHPQSLVEHFFERLRKSKDATQEYWRGYEDLFNKLEVCCVHIFTISQAVLDGGCSDALRFVTSGLCLWNILVHPWSSKELRKRLEKVTMNLKSKRSSSPVKSALVQEVLTPWRCSRSFPHPCKPHMSRYVPGWSNSGVPSFFPVVIWRTGLDRL